MPDTRPVLGLHRQGSSKRCLSAIIASSNSSFNSSAYDSDDSSSNDQTESATKIARSGDIQFAVMQQVVNNRCCKQTRDVVEPSIITPSTSLSSTTSMSCDSGNNNGNGGCMLMHTINAKMPVVQGGGATQVMMQQQQQSLARSTNARMICSSLKDNRSRIPEGFHPHEFIKRVLMKKGVTVDVVAYNDASLSLLPSLKQGESFFLPPTPKEIAAYNLEVINAVRTGDIALLRQYHQQGRPLKCSNQFGENLLSLACRKQLVDVVSFLVHEAGVPLRVCDDYGRNPLHDACWTSTPNFALVDLILDSCPDLLYIKDKRGHTPLFYSRREHWVSWIQHLATRMNLLMPKILPILPYKPPQQQQQQQQVMPVMTQAPTQQPQQQQQHHYTMRQYQPILPAPAAN